MAQLKINSEYCKGCNLCVLACKKNVLEIGTESNKKGYRYVAQGKGKECIGCKACSVMCPEGAIEIYK
ncbi:4Fe-4S dicluster domain-containing protein [Lutispora saccharofermentans]|uniref:4Fe-4S dicluster domain-containing protein n=1 Tax=Lutispora saccharofermentans TaxID=3024236 RepID=A0ABT1NML2_9FIRM|nr:4Fe-4S dicluster domain-containing protein [Lutispora saccharofermentans]MCQ1531166.1 4Fe-4S dicluster domain-containing protein [Lutispora saccharofermentans]